MSLYLAQSQRNFKKNITVADDCNIVFVETNNRISFSLSHHLTKLKLNNPKLKVFFFNDVLLFNNWFSMQVKKQHFCLFIDGNTFNCNEIDLRSSEDPLSFSLTVFYQHQTIISERVLNSLNVSFIPFDYASEISLQVYNENPDLVFIDDDDLLRRAWKLKAEFSNKVILCFSSATEFETIMPFISPQTPIYIDSFLGDNAQGEEVSKKFYDAGFETIFLATGRCGLDIKKPQWIHAVVNKSPPF